VKRGSGDEILDGDGVPEAVRQASMRDVTRSNAWLAGRRAVVREMDALLRGSTQAGSSITLLDIGTGLADIPAHLVRTWKARGVRIISVGLDSRPDLLREARDGGRIAHAVSGSALSLPFASGSVDVVLCSQVLHHFAGDELDALVREANRVARRGVVIADLRRSPLAAAGFYIAAWLLGFHAVTRHDGVVSVRKGFTSAELRATARRAAGASPAVHRRLLFRLTTSWAPRETVSGDDPYALREMPEAMRMTTVDERLVRAPLEHVFALAADVERWADHLGHYRAVHFRERARDGGGLVEMAANRPFGVVQWPTWWTSHMLVRRPGDPHGPPVVRYRHVQGITTGMEVEWSFARVAGGTHVRIIHRWNGPPFPVIGQWVARAVIGPVFVHGIASRTLAGLAHVAERTQTPVVQER